MNRLLSRYITPLYVTGRTWTLLSIAVIGFVMAFFYPWLSILPRILTGITLGLFVLDHLMLFLPKQGFRASRELPERLSNGDENPVSLHLKSDYPFTLSTEIIDEFPVQFQLRDTVFRCRLGANGENTLRYQLRPTKRGAYGFGVINVYVKSPIGMIMRRYKCGEPVEVPVYPSYLQMRRYQLMAISNRLSEIGVKKIRRIGHSMEFEQVKEYVKGDDFRTINWKATARRGQLMSNAYTDEKSQQVYCLIDKSRVMKMPFNGLSLLDHAINAAVVLSNVALLRNDKAGVITFSEEIGGFLPAARTATQMNAVLDMLHRQKTRYLESDYGKLYALIRKRVTQRSLLLLFTNFATVNGLRRQLGHLRRLAEHHLLIVIFFEDTELRGLLRAPADGLEEIYQKTIAEKFAFEKKQIISELQHWGIMSIFTAPEDLTVNTVNKYLELKARQQI
jgi:uncharacterized protein (DUF58 family)